MLIEAVEIPDNLFNDFEWFIVIGRGDCGKNRLAFFPQGPKVVIQYVKLDMSKAALSLDGPLHCRFESMPIVE